jgi:hypothetical protein
MADDRCFIIITKGTVADCTEAIPLIEGFPAEFLFSGSGYDRNKIIDFAEEKLQRGTIL